MAAKKSTLQKVTDTVRDAAVAVVHAAEEHVVQPVGKTLGLIKSDEPLLIEPKRVKPQRIEPKGIEPKPTSKSAIKAARKTMVKAVMEKKPRRRAAGIPVSARPVTAKANMNIPTNKGRVPNSRPGAGRAR